VHERAAALLAREPDALFAILDGARDLGISRRLRTSGLTCQSLYQGDAGEELAPFGPYLVTLPQEPAALDPWLRGTWGQSVGVYLTCKQPFAALRHHLRRFLTVQLDGGRKVYFRFYDPRVLRRFLPSCTYDEWIEFFGPIDAYLMESEDGHALLRFRRDAELPEPEPIDLAVA
jgi:hypothetical protein